MVTYPGYHSTFTKATSYMPSVDPLCTRKMILLIRLQRPLESKFRCFSFQLNFANSFSSSLVLFFFTFAKFEMAISNMDPWTCHLHFGVMYDTNYHFRTIFVFARTKGCTSKTHSSIIPFCTKVLFCCHCISIWQVKSMPLAPFVKGLNVIFVIKCNVQRKNKLMGKTFDSKWSLHLTNWPSQMRDEKEQSLKLHRTKVSLANFGYCPLHQSLFLPICSSEDADACDTLARWMRMLVQYIFT